MELFQVPGKHINVNCIWNRILIYAFIDSEVYSDAKHNCSDIIHTLPMWAEKLLAAFSSHVVTISC